MAARMMRSSVLAMALAACAPATPEAAMPTDAKRDVLGFLAALAEAPPIDEAFVERALRLRLNAHGAESMGSRGVSHGKLTATARAGSAKVFLPGRLPDVPCVLSIGELLDHAKSLGYEVDFYDLGSKPMLTLTKDHVGRRMIGVNVMTNPPAGPGERQACVSMITAGTEGRG